MDKISLKGIRKNSLRQGEKVGTRCIEVQRRKDKIGHKREKSGYNNNKYTNSGMD